MGKELHSDIIKVLLALFLLTILNFNIPFLSLFIYIIWPLPIIYLFLKYGRKYSLMIIILSAVINGLIFGTVMGVYSIIGYGFIGFIIGTSLKEGFSPKRTLILSVLIVLFSNIIITFFSEYILDLGYNKLFNDFITIIEQSPEFSDLNFILKQQIEMIKSIFPALLVISSIITGILTYYATLWFLNKKGLRYQTFKAIKYWHFPNWPISLGIIICLLLKSNMYSANFLIVLLFLAFLQGFAVGLFKLSKVNNSSLMKTIYILVVILFSFLSFIVLALLGLVDMWFDLRREKTEVNY